MVPGALRAVCNPSRLGKKADVDAADASHGRNVKCVLGDYSTSQCQLLPALKERWHSQTRGLLCVLLRSGRSAQRARIPSSPTAHLSQTACCALQSVSACMDRQLLGKKCFNSTSTPHVPINLLLHNSVMKPIAAPLSRRAVCPAIRTLRSSVRDVHLRRMPVSYGLPRRPLVKLVSSASLPGEASGQPVRLEPSLEGVKEGLGADDAVQGTRFVHLKVRGWLRILVYVTPRPFTAT